MGKNSETKTTVETKKSALQAKAAKNGAGFFLFLGMICSFLLFAAFAFLTVKVIIKEKIFTDFMNRLLDFDVKLWIFIGFTVLFLVLTLVCIALMKVAKNSIIQVDNTLALLKALKKGKKKEKTDNSMEENIDSYVKTDILQTIKNPVTEKDYEQLYEGKLFCETCGSPMIPMMGTKGNLLIYCQNKYTNPGKCSNLTIKNDTLQKEFLRWYNETYNANFESFSANAFNRSVKKCIIGKTIVFEGNDNVAIAKPSEENNPRNNFDF